MDLIEAIRQRHSVRAYTDAPIEEDKRRRLDALAEQYSHEGRISIRIVYDEPKGFDSFMAHYGSFRNVRNYIVLAGDQNEDIDERCGYYGEQLVLHAQTLGLNTCWVALTFNKKQVKEQLKAGERLCVVIALGYGADNGREHKSKPIDKVAVVEGAPQWFCDGVKAALAAPTAVNQQKFRFDLIDGEPVAAVSSKGPCTKVDLGIVKCHFEVATGRRVR